MTTLPCITFPVLIHQEDVTLWTELYHKYHKEGADSLKMLLASESPTSRTVPSVREKSVRSLFEIVTEECTCNKCFVSLCREDRLPWIRTPSLSLRHCIAATYNPCSPVKKLLPERGYIYRAAPTIKEKLAVAKIEKAITESEVKKKEIEVVSRTEEAKTNIKLEKTKNQQAYQTETTDRKKELELDEQHVNYLREQHRKLEKEYQRVEEQQKVAYVRSENMRDEIEEITKRNIMCANRAGYRKQTISQTMLDQVQRDEDEHKRLRSQALKLKYSSKEAAVKYNAALRELKSKRGTSSPNQKKGQV